MLNLTPTPRDERPALPAFDAVPRKPRHDGWTPARQVAFIEALADTGSVKSAAAQVNMSSESAYALRRAPGAEGFTRAWEAALDMGVLRLKDEAFERALHGELVPIVSAGKLLGYRRKRNDYLLMFLLRHYTEAGGRRVPVDALRSPAKRGTTRETAPLPAPPESAAATVADFAGVALDQEAQAQIVAVLTACAARTRALDIVDDPAEPHVTEHEMPPDHPDAIHTPGATSEDYVEPRDGDEDWRTLDLPDHRAAIAAAVASVKAAKARGELEPLTAEEIAASRAEVEAEAERRARRRAYFESGKPLEYWTG